MKAPRGGSPSCRFPFSGFARHNPVVGIEDVISNAKRLGITPVQVALARTLGLAPNIMLIPDPSGTGGEPRGCRHRARRPGAAAADSCRSLAGCLPVCSSTAPAVSHSSGTAERDRPQGRTTEMSLVKDPVTGLTWPESVKSCRPAGPRRPKHTSGPRARLIDRRGGRHVRAAGRPRRHTSAWRGPSQGIA